MSAERVHPDAGLLFGAAFGEPPEARRSRRFRVGWLMTAIGVAQTASVVLIVAVTFRPAASAQPKLVARLFVDPAPAAPLPLPKGAPGGAEAVRPEATKADTPEPRPADDAVAMPSDAIEERQEIEPGPERSPEGPSGSATGSEHGDASGMDGGIDDGMLGGRFGGSPNGVPNGTGTEPVTDYDAPPRLVRQTRPRYPTEAFVQKIQGTVVLEILIDSSGRVSQARVIQSIPPLDAAARDAVREWLFQPALKRGRPVAARALAPVRFGIY